MSGLAPDDVTNVSDPGPRSKVLSSVRLLRHADFERVYKQGRRHFAAHMTVFYLPRKAGEGVRVGFTVGRMLGGAVVRNRIRRRLREIVRCHRQEIPTGWDIVIHPKSKVARAPFAPLTQEFLQLMKGL